jgi:predicted O-methyltransferase YrrM
VSIAAACGVSKSKEAATLLHLLILAHEPTNCIELGTNLGISAAYQASALALTGRGRFTSLETSPRRLEVARRLTDSLGLSNIDFVRGSFEDRLAGVLSNCGAIDYAFIDGNHRFVPTLAYFDAIWGSSSEGALIVFDDIRWSREMTTAWRRIRRDARVRIAVDLWEVGVCITTRQPSSSANYRFGPIIF